MNMKHILLTLALALCSAFAAAQSRTTIGTVTDIDGRYSLNVEGNPQTPGDFHRHAAR